MPHLLDTQKGFNAFIIANGGPAWHGLDNATKGKDYQNTENVLHDAGLDFTVLKMPNQHNVPSLTTPGEFDEIVSENSFFTYRTDTNFILGDKLGRDYTVLQNVEALNFVDEILQAGTATIETAGSIDNGKQIFICLKLNAPIVVNGTDFITQYLLITTAHDGSRATIIMGTNTRVVCNNTLSAALRERNKSRFSIRHTSNAKDRIREALKAVKLINEQEQRTAEDFQKMADLKISKEQMLSYFGNIYLEEAEIKALQEGKRITEVASSQKINTLNELLYFAQKGKGQAETMKGTDFTAWTAYNAVTGVIARQKYNTPDERAKALLFGTAADRIQQAGELALTMEKVKPCHKINNATGFNLN